MTQCRKCREMLGVPCPLQMPDPGRQPASTRCPDGTPSVPGECGRQGNRCFSVSPGPAFLGPSFRQRLTCGDQPPIGGVSQPLRGQEVGKGRRSRKEEGGRRVSGMWNIKEETLMGCRAAPQRAEASTGRRSRARLGLATLNFKVCTCKTT